MPLDKLDKKERDQLYSVWTSMKSRCSNANDHDYGRYGGRGIKVCQRWIESFADFMNDMGKRELGQTIERINNAGNYEPENCKWVTRGDQAKNRGYAEGETHEFDAEIFSVGTWTDASGSRDKYTDADLDNMVENFNKLKETVKPPVKLGHKEEGQPSIGWVKALKRVGDKLIGTLTQVPDLVMKAIQSGRYKRISSEIYFNHKHAGETFKRVLAGVALLGADIPAVANLKDLDAYLSQSTLKGSFDMMKSYALDVDEAGKIINIENKGLSNMEEKEYKLKIAELEAKKAESDKKAADAEVEKKASDERLAQFEKDKETEHKKTQIEGIKKYCEDMVKAKKMLPYQRDILVKDLDKRSYSKEDGHIFNFEMVKDLFKDVDIILDVKEYGHDKNKKGKDLASPADELEAKTHEYMEKHPDMGYKEASDIVFKKNPKLATAYAMDEGGDE